ncbi:MAG: hypothetical protein SCJ97_10490 [Bacillota bacterium]|nr:hypothetical protein [Bacillota bacterium]
MHHYHHLGDKLSRHPVGAPKTEEFIEILKILFKPDEIEVATHLEFIPRTASDIASEAGLSFGEVSVKLESLANRGAVLAKRKNGDTYYSLLPNYPGLFEYPLMKGLNPQEEKRLAELWHAYYMQDMAAELASARPPWIRVFPAEEALPADEEIEIIPYEKASELLKKTEDIALARCPCRVIGKNCDKPLDVCLSFDGAARFLAERGMARFISREEALQVLRESEEAGLVHTGSNITERLYFMCNCCSCCCHMLMLLTKHGFKEGIARSAYRAELDQAACTGCAICVEERCPVGALTMDADRAGSF